MEALAEMIDQIDFKLRTLTNVLAIRDREMAEELRAYLKASIDQDGLDLDLKMAAIEMLTDLQSIADKLGES